MPNFLGSPLSSRPTEGYSKNIQATDPTQLDAAGNPIITEVGDAKSQGVRVNDVTSADMMPPEAVPYAADGKNVSGQTISTPVPGERGDGVNVVDRQTRSLLEALLYWQRALWFGQLYQNQGGICGTGQTIFEFLSAHGMEMNPFDTAESPMQGGQLHPIGDR